MPFEPLPQQMPHLIRDVESFRMQLGRRKTQIRLDWAFSKVFVAEHIVFDFINTKNNSISQLGQFDFRLSTSIQSQLRTQKEQLYALGFTTDSNKLRRFLSPSIVGLDFVTNPLGANRHEMYERLASRVQPAERLRYTDQAGQSLCLLQRGAYSLKRVPLNYRIIVTSTGYILRELFAVASRYQHTIKEVYKVIEFLYSLVVRWSMSDKKVATSGFATRQELRDFSQELKLCASVSLVSTANKLDYTDQKDTKDCVIWDRRRGAVCTTHNEQLTFLGKIIEYLRRQHKLRFISRLAALGDQDDHGNSWYCFSCTTRWSKDHRSFRSDRAMWDHLNAKHDFILNDIITTGSLI